MSKVLLESAAVTKDPQNSQEYGVRVVEGEQLLHVLDYWNTQVSNGLGLAWHGSPRLIEGLILRTRPFWVQDGVRYPDSQGSIVCAAPAPLMAAFYALATRGPGRRKIAANENGGADFMVNRQYREEFLRAVGFVAAVSTDTDNFSLFDDGAPSGWPGSSYMRPPELRSPEHELPLFVVRVDYQAFEELLSTHPSSSLYYYS